MRFIVTILLFLYSLSLNAQQVDRRVRTLVSPVRVVWQNDADHIRNTEMLFQEANAQSSNFDAKATTFTMSSKDGARPAILLDFGRELNGTLQIVTNRSSNNSPVRVRVTLGESVSEALSEVGGKGGATNDHAIRDTELLLPFMGVASTGESGFRFAKIELIDPNKTLSIKEITAVSIMRDAPYLGSFKSSDERLNQIWETGARTVHLCMQTHLWDGIKRDRLVWVGDSYPEIMSILSVFGYNEVVPASLDLLRDTTPLPGWMNGAYSTYSIWWLLCHYEWYRYTGDLEYLNQSRDYIKELLGILTAKIDDNGREKLDGFRMLDWPSMHNEKAKSAGIQALMVWAMRVGQEFAVLFDDKQLADDCSNAEQKLMKAAPQVYEQFSKSYQKADEPGAKQVAALVSITGLEDAKKINDEVLSYNGASGFSTFYGYFMLEAMAKAGNYQGAMDVIKTYWGAMLDLGATSFWEDFNMDWIEGSAGIDEIVPEGKKDIHGDFGAYCYVGFRHSLCHGWASGPTAWLSRHVLGVEVLEPGCTKVKVSPNLGDLDWAEGSFPTPYGAIEIRHVKNPDGSISSTISGPEQVEIVR